MSTAATVFKHTDPDDYIKVVNKTWWDVVDVMVYRDLPSKKAAQRFMERYQVKRSPANNRLTRREWVDEALQGGVK